MSTTPELRRQVTREMIEAHYKSVMNAARLLLSQGETIHAQDLLSEACSRPYPIPAPASMPATKFDAVLFAEGEWTATIDNVPVSGAIYNSKGAAIAGAEVEYLRHRLIDADLASFARAYCAMRAAQTAYFKTRSREDLINSKRLEKALDKAAAIVAADVAGTIRRGTP